MSTEANENPPQINIVHLEIEHWQQFRDLRLRALKEEPTAFGQSYEDAVSLSEEDWKKRLTNRINLFASVNGILVGMVSAGQQEGAKNRHIVNVNGVYVAPEARRSGVGRKLMTQLLSELSANDSVRKIRLTVSAPQKAAFELYQSLGFEKVAMYKEELFVDGKYIDEYGMEKIIR